MKRIFTYLAFLALTIGSTFAAGDWMNYSVTNITGTGNYTMNYDTMYVSIGCRNGKYEYMQVRENGVLTAAALPIDYVDVADSTQDKSRFYTAGDSLTWKVVKGASIGTTPRVRFVNLKTGEYLAQGANDSTGTVKAFVTPRSNPFNAVIDFELRDQGKDSKGTYYYFIVDGLTQFFNDVNGAINLKSTSTQGWKFVPRSGPLPKVHLPMPVMTLTPNTDAPFAGGSVTLTAKVAPNGGAVSGSTLLYYGTTLLDTLTLDANGEASYQYDALPFGEQKFILVYTGDEVHSAEDLVLNLNVGPDPTAKLTKIQFTLPETAEVHSDVTMNITVETTDGGVVTHGDVAIMVDTIVKNIIPVDVLGMTSITFPNLVPGTTKITAYFIGDRMAFLNSDTVATDIVIGESTASVKPYPVTFDLNQYFPITKWVRDSTDATTARPFTKVFTQEELEGSVVLQDSAAKLSAVFGALTYTSSDLKNLFMNASTLNMDLGSGRSKTMNLKTPWLNSGSYNVYISQRLSLEFNINIDSVQMDGKDLYFPSTEMYGRWIRSWNGANNRKRWSAHGHNGNVPLIFLGSVNIDESGTHNLEIFLRDENGYNGLQFDMLQFMPVDQEKYHINNAAKAMLDSISYPLFDLGGFARLEGEAASNTFADATEMALPYQAQDLTPWETSSVTIDSLGMTMVGDLVANYVTVYSADDKWTRVAEGYITESFDFTCDLPKNRDYYYEEIFFYDPGTSIGAQNVRYFISSGTVSTKVGVGTIDVKPSSIFTFATDGKLVVKGIEAGDRVIVADITGKVVSNKIASSDVQTLSLNKGVYIVKVAGSESAISKVIIK